MEEGGIKISCNCPKSKSGHIYNSHSTTVVKKTYKNLKIIGPFVDYVSP